MFGDEDRRQISVSLRSLVLQGEERTSLYTPALVHASVKPNEFVTTQLLFKCTEFSCLGPGS